MLLAITADVLLRNIFVTGIRGIVEYTEYGLYLATVLAAPALLRSGQHIRVDLLGQFGSGAILKIVDVFSDLLGLVTTFVVGWYAVKSTIDSYMVGSVIRRTIDIAEWVFIAPLDLSLVLLFGEFGFRLIDSLRKLPFRSEVKAD